MIRSVFSYLDISIGGPPQRRRIAINDEAVAAEYASEEIAFGTAINIAPIDEAQDDWIEVAPYGEHPNQLGTQVLDRAAAEEIAANANSFAGRLGRFFRGIPIYRGHPHQRPDIWPDDTRYGRVNELRAGEKALEGKVAWNDLGQKNKEQGYWVYPSPGWNFRKLTGGKIRPFRLDHIGLTNNPNISESVPVTNSRISDASRIGGSAEPQQTQPKGHIMEKTKLIAALGLKAEATDDEILTAINSLQDKEKNPLVVAINTQLATATTEKQNAENEAKKFRDLAINAQLDRFTDKGVITAAERDGFKTKLEADFDGAVAELSGKQPALNTKGLTLSPSGKDLSDASKRRVAFNSRLDELMASGLSFNASIDAMKANQEDAALLKAMDTAIA